MNKCCRVWVVDTRGQWKLSEAILGLRMHQRAWIYRSIFCNLYLMKVSMINMLRRIRA
jgi:hypothetical protein